MKLYIHYEGERGGPDFTFVWKIQQGDEECLWKDAAASFVQAYRSAHPGVREGPLNGQNLKLELENGVTLRDRGGPLDSEEIVNSGDDIFVKIEAQDELEVKEGHAEREPREIPKEISKEPQKRRSATKDGSALTKGSAADLEIAKCLETASALMKDRRARRAGEIFEAVLSIDSSNLTAWRGRATILRRNKMWEHCVKVYEDLMEKSSPEAQDHYYLAYAQRKLGNLDEAVNSLDAARASLRKSRDAPISVEDIDAQLAWCKLQLDAAQDAADLFQSVLVRTGEAHVEALNGYATLALLIGQRDAALQPLLKAVVMDPKNELTEQLLSELLRTEEGFGLLRQQLGEKKESGAQIYAFLAMIVKDCSALDLSIRLLHAALEIVPANASYALNLVHCYEIANRHQEAFRATKDFLRSNGDARVGQHGLSNRSVLEVLEPMESVSQAVPSEAQWRLEWIAKDSTDSHAVCQYIGGSSSPPRESELPAPGSAAENFDGSSLDLLALHFTTVKMLYSCGALAVIPSLIQLIEPTRQISKVPLHTTNIRNEHAYYTCISQLLSLKSLDSPTFLPGDTSGSPIYVCADSHTLTPVWNAVTVNGEQRLLVPALVTGMKHWHLRPDSTFYPKYNFLRVIESIPAGSTVIFIFGEIDCREGMLVAVERGKYESLEQASESAIGYFIAALKPILKKKDFHALIHPVIPVLKETRSIVKTYNAIFKRMVEAQQGKSRMYWLDIFSQLLSDDGERLRDGLELDGTHLNPAYIPILETGINQASLLLEEAS